MSSNGNSVDPAGGGSPAGDGWVCDATSCRPGSGQCFVAGTPVSTPEGARPIEQIVAGDRVLSRDEETGEFSTRAVLRTFVRPATGLVDVRMARGDESASDVRSTAGHPYWTLASGWTRADSLAPGDYLAAHGWGFTRENFHAETGLATYANMNNAHGLVAGVSRPFCNTGVCENLMGRTFGLGNVGVRQNVPSSAQINAQANAASASGSHGNNAVAGPSTQGGAGCN
ncbi:HINT domain-containing protein [Pendulispora brunnea]|uniref:HINT domain-containing protein n=1 Tax=Pendulispora brunnea TaxID=2905690 RepID=A0ABZ2JUL8_9BACT